MRRVVVFDPYQAGDLGMRNLGVVTLLEVGRASQAPPKEQGCPDGARDAASTPGSDTVDDVTRPSADTTVTHDTDTEEIVEDTVGRAASQGAAAGAAD
ncbi:MAG: hypothetical protein ACRDQ9_08140 [Pseudonocardiaceae bacterium]